MWWRAVCASRRWLSFAGVSLLLSALLLTPVSATETTVDVLVCNPGSTAELIIDEPPSDSVTSISPITVKGKAYQTSQLEFRVDGVLDKTVALPKGTVDFSVPISLTKGTHTITVTAIDVCGSDNDVKHIVITYQPPPEPSPGPEPSPSPSPDQPSDRPSDSGAGTQQSGGDDDGGVTPGADIPTDLPGDKTDGDREKDGLVFWPLSFVWDGSPLSFLLRFIIALCGAFLLSLRPHHFARIFEQNLAEARWPYPVCWLLWFIGLLLILFAIFGI